jgi:hypothetical protein
LNAGRLGALGDALADDRCRGGIATLAGCAELGAQILLHRGSGREDARTVVGDDAGVDVQVGAKHREARHVLLDDAHARLTRTAQTLVSLVQHGCSAAPYFFFVSLRETRSSA